MTAAPSTAAVLEELLPCVATDLHNIRLEDGSTPFPHTEFCPARYRPAVAAALSAKDAEIARLREECIDRHVIQHKLDALEISYDASSAATIAARQELVKQRATILTLRSALEPVAEAFKRLGPTGYFPAMGAPLSDKIRNAVAEFFPEVGKVVGSSFDRKAQ